ncbi:MAG TPA: hypothetical protein PLR41_14470, partial [Alphaproteobacteria bacterium]|nr:hypothetical protein [Alphaproteobacteria bacterium]
NSVIASLLNHRKFLGICPTSGASLQVSQRHGKKADGLKRMETVWIKHSTGQLPEPYPADGRIMPDLEED